jgi:hypothetical protein
MIELGILELDDTDGFPHRGRPPPRRRLEPPGRAVGLVGHTCAQLEPDSLGGRWIARWCATLG